MQEVRRHFTYANVMATLAMFAVLGGGAYAAKKIGSSDIKKNAVRSKHIKKNQVKSSDIKNSQVKSSDIKNNQVKASDIKDGDVGSAELANGGIDGIDIANDALGGPQIDENSLGKVPSAVTADTITGTKIVAFDYEIQGGGGGGANVTTLVDRDNFVLKAQCPAGGGGISMTIFAETKVNNAEIRFHSSADGNPTEVGTNTDFDIGDDFKLFNGGGDDVIGTAEYRNGGQNVVSVQFHGSRSFADFKCRASGHVLLS